MPINSLCCHPGPWGTMEKNKGPGALGCAALSQEANLTEASPLLFDAMRGEWLTLN